MGDAEPEPDNHWDTRSVETIIGWITIGSYMIEALEMSIDWCRGIVRTNTIIGIALSTASGSISVINYGTSGGVVLNILFTVFSFIVAVNSSRVKIFQIQERMEQCMKLRHEWSTFVTNLSTEVQLPVPMRKDANLILEDNRTKYMNLLRLDCEMPYFVKHKIKMQMKARKLRNEHHMALIRNNGLSLSDITFDIAVIEGESRTILNEIVVESNPVFHEPRSLVQSFKNFVKM